jgi:hypothetical protein
VASWLQWLLLAVPSVATQLPAAIQAEQQQQPAAEPVAIAGNATRAPSAGGGSTPAPSAAGGGAAGIAAVGVGSSGDDAGGANWADGGGMAANETAALQVAMTGLVTAVRAAKQQAGTGALGGGSAAGGIEVAASGGVTSDAAAGARSSDPAGSGDKAPAAGGPAFDADGKLAAAAAALLRLLTSAAAQAAAAEPAPPAGRGSVTGSSTAAGASGDGPGPAALLGDDLEALQELSANLQVLGCRGMAYACPLG